MSGRKSSLHHDLILPWQDRSVPEYCGGRGGDGKLLRYSDIGTRGEDSIIQRVSQFGVLLDSDNPLEITQTDYGRLVKNAVESEYETIFASVYTSWSEMSSKEEQIGFIKDTCSSYHNWGLRIALSSTKIDLGRTNVVLALEGADAIRDIKDFWSVFIAGVRCVGLQYGEDNAIADENGLTDFGVKAVKTMLDRGMIVDLAHSVPLVRRDVLDLAEDGGRGNMVAYTHGSQREDIAVDPLFGGNAEKRGLTKEEIGRIVRLGGMIGLGVSRPFFQDIDAIASRIDSICQLDGGLRSIGIGSDFGGVAKDWLIGINSSADMGKIGQALSQRFGYKGDDIDAILRSNVTEWLKSHK